MIGPDVENSVAIAGDVWVVGLFPVPVVAENVLHDVVICAGGHSIDGIVAAHYAPNFRIAGTLLEWRHVVACEVLASDKGVEAVADYAILMTISQEPQFIEFNTRSLTQISMS